MVRHSAHNLPRKSAAYQCISEVDLSPDSGDLSKMRYPEGIFVIGFKELAKKALRRIWTRRERGFGISVAFQRKQRGLLFPDDSPLGCQNCCKSQKMTGPGYFCALIVPPEMQPGLR